jgi:hypothetical protein
MPPGYGYSPEGLARYRKDQEQKRTLGSTDAPRITASPSPVRPRVQRKTDPNPLAHFSEMFANLGGQGRMSDQDLERVRRMIPTLFDTQNVSQDKLGRLGGGRISDQDLERMRRMIPSAFDTQNVSQDKLGRLGQFSKSFATLGGELGRKSDVDVRRAKRRNKVPR